MLRIMLVLCCIVSLNVTGADIINHGKFKVDLHRAMLISILQSESFGKSYVIESLNNDFKNINYEDYFKALKVAKEQTMKDIVDISRVKKACLSLGELYISRTKLPYLDDVKYHTCNIDFMVKK